MRSKVHYLSEDTSIFQHKGFAACGIYTNVKHFDDRVTQDPDKVTCGNCLCSKLLKGPDRCVKCDVLVGSDYTGKAHKCKLCD